MPKAEPDKGLTRAEHRRAFKSQAFTAILSASAEYSWPIYCCWPQMREITSRLLCLCLRRHVTDIKRILNSRQNLRPFPLCYSGASLGVLGIIMCFLMLTMVLWVRPNRRRRLRKHFMAPASHDLKLRMTVQNRGRMDLRLHRKCQEKRVALSPRIYFFKPLLHFYLGNPKASLATVSSRF